MILRSLFVSILIFSQSTMAVLNSEIESLLSVESKQNEDSEKRSVKEITEQAVKSGRYQFKGRNPASQNQIQIEAETETKNETKTNTKDANPKNNDSLLDSEVKTIEQHIKSDEVILIEKKIEQPTVIEQVKEIISDGEQPLIQAYREQVHPDDVRLNRIEINIGGGVLANTAKSNYSFRNYSTFSPQLSVGAGVWMTPFLGLSGSYYTSVGADVLSDISTNSKSQVQHETTELSFNLRKFFGMSRRANSIEYGLFYTDYHFSVPSDDLHRISLKSSGVGIHLSTRIPVAPTYAWIFGGKIVPRMKHQEQTTGIDLSSGNNGESSRVDLFLGGEIKMNRKSQIIWNLSVIHEKNQFSGQANRVDPETGQRPNGVSVNNNMTLFNFGYRWGQ